MKNIFFAGMFILLLLQKGIAQEKNLSFSSQTYIGLLAGEAEASPVVQTINGIKWKQWFGGVGTGIDWYYLRSVPLFLSVNRSFLPKGKRSLFVSADAGYNFPWYQNYYYDFGANNLQRKGGLYLGTGVGYKFGVGKADNGVLLHLGYSIKNLEESQTYVNPCLVGPCPEYTERYNYRLRRVSLRVGWGF